MTSRGAHIDQFLKENMMNLRKVQENRAGGESLYPMALETFGRSR